VVASASAAMETINLFMVVLSLLMGVSNRPPPGRIPATACYSVSLQGKFSPRRGIIADGRDKKRAP